MPRRVQDIVATDRKSIRNIPLRDQKIEDGLEPEKTRRKSHSEESVIPKEKGKEISIRRMHSVPEKPEKRVSTSKNGFKWILIALLIIVGILGIAWIASMYFSKATFTIIPKKYPVTVNGTYIAQGSGGALTYELVTLSASASTTALSTDGPAVSTKAQGTVTLYNDNKDSQRLVAGTRLSSSDGLIYRITDSVTIPGKTSKSGTLNTAVVADKAGNEYNLNKNQYSADFKIVGFKGTDRYATVYAKIATDIIGGFTGSKKIISSEDLASSSASLMAQISQELLEKAHKSIPDDHIMFDEIKSLTFSQPQISGNGGEQATISMQGTLIGIFFNKKQLVERLAGKEIVEHFGSFSYESPGLENLEISIANARDFSPQKKNSLIVKIKGDMELVGVVPIDELRQKLAGIELNQTDSILKPYSPVIESGSGELIPPWAKVPTDEDRISVNIKK